MAGLFLLALPGHGHPLPLPAPASPDTVRLGMGEAELRTRAGDALQPGLLSRKDAPPLGSGLAAFHRQFPPPADLAYAEYEPGSPAREEIPASVRSSPGGYRSFHFWHTGYNGGK